MMAAIFRATATVGLTFLLFGHYDLLSGLLHSLEPSARIEYRVIIDRSVDVFSVSDFLFSVVFAARQNEIIGWMETVGRATYVH